MVLKCTYFGLKMYNGGSTTAGLQGSHSLEKSLYFFEKSLNFCASPLKVLEFSSTLSEVPWKVFFDAFWLSKTEYKSFVRELEGDLHN